MPFKAWHETRRGTDTDIFEHSQVMNQDTHEDHFVWMRRCRELADDAIRWGEAPVGAVVVRDGVMIAEACEQVKAKQDVAGHAEILAIRRACQALGTLDLAGCELFTTMEPCWMCSFAIRETGISRVVIGRAVADIGGVTSRFPILADAPLPGWGLPPEIVWAT